MFPTGAGGKSAPPVAAPGPSGRPFGGDNSVPGRRCGASILPLPVCLPAFVSAGLCQVGLSWLLRSEWVFGVSVQTAWPVRRIPEVKGPQGVRTRGWGPGRHHGSRGRGLGDEGMSLSPQGRTGQPGRRDPPRSPMAPSRGRGGSPLMPDSEMPAQSENGAGEGAVLGDTPCPSGYTGVPGVGGLRVKKGRWVGPAGISGDSKVPTTQALCQRSALCRCTPSHAILFSFLAAGIGNAVLLLLRLCPRPSALSEQAVRLVRVSSGCPPPPSLPRLSV